MNKYWISWYSPNTGFELHFPCWISGWCYDKEDNEITIICAAVKADNENEAADIIRNCYEVPEPNLEFRFISLKPDDWSPYCDRFPKAEWMDFK